MPYYRGRGYGPEAWIVVAAALWAATLLLRRIIAGH
jgi:hypothetical protein